MWFLRKLLLTGLLGVGLAGAAAAQDMVLASQHRFFKAGENAEILVTFLNKTKAPIGIPATIGGDLFQSHSRFDVVLSTRQTGSISPGAFAQVTYYVPLPADLISGLMELVVRDTGATSLLLEVGRSDRKQLAQTKDTQNEDEQDKLPDNKPSFLVDGLSPYKPIYFLGGVDPTDAKFQISFKYQLFNNKGDWAKHNHWLRGFHLAYTQVSFWDLAGDSRPFEDTNFMPEVFYGLKDLELKFLPGDPTVDLQAGFQHESNGRDGLDSRSLNIIYGRAAYRHGFGLNWFAKISGELWSYTGDLEDNPDIADFRGHSSFRLTAGHEKGVQLSAYRRGRIGQGKSSYLFDLTFPFATPGTQKRLNFNLHAQLFTGYGENLLTYKQKETRFRLGLGLYR